MKSANIVGKCSNLVEFGSAEANDGRLFVCASFRLHMHRLRVHFDDGCRIGETIMLSARVRLDENRRAAFARDVQFSLLTIVLQLNSCNEH